MLNFKIISTQIENPFLVKLKAALRELLTKTTWDNKELGLQAFNEELFMKANNIQNDYFPQRINLGCELGKEEEIVERADNKKTFNFKQIKQIIEHVKLNSKLYIKKKENDYNESELKSKLNLSKDHLLYFLALAEEDLLVRFCYKDDYFLIPFDIAKEVMSVFVAKKAMTKISKNKQEDFHSSLAIDEIKQQLKEISKSEQVSNPVSVDSKLQSSQPKELHELLDDEVPAFKKPTLESIKKEINSEIAPEKKIAKPQIQKIVQPAVDKDPLLEKVFAFLADTGENIRGKIYDFLAEPAPLPIKQKNIEIEYKTDQAFFNAAIDHFTAVNIEDFFKPSKLNPKLTRLDVLTNDFKNETLPVGALGEEKLRIRRELSKLLLPKLKRNISLVFSVSSLRYEQVESLIEIILAFNDPLLAEQIKEAVKNKLILVGFTLAREATTQLEKNELKELYAELLFLHKLILKRFQGSRTTLNLEQKGSLLDLSR